MSASTLAKALAEGGIRSVVEERGRLAVVVARDAAQAESIVAGRRWIVSTAAAHGFSHVALEIAMTPHVALPPSSDAALSGD